MQLPIYNNLDDKFSSFFYSSKDVLNKNSNGFIENQEKFVINTKEDFELFYNKIHNNKRLVFRGVNEAKYKLYTSIQRNFIEGRINKNEDISSFVSKEINCLRSYDTLTEYYNVLGLPVTDYLYLSFLQHYAAPTPFLDFSHNLDVALYFATENVRYGNGNGNPSIDEYFSVYWIDVIGNKKDIINIPQFFKNLYIDIVKTYIEYIADERTDFDLDIETFLSWNGIGQDGLNNIRFGFIDSNNKSKHYPIGNLKTVVSLIDKNIKNHLKNRSASSMKNLKKIISNYIDEIIKIVNLNLIAQKGCFIHYIPDNVNIKEPLEDLLNKNGVYVHCVNIHKSLASYIINKNVGKKITFETIYPEPKNFAHQAMVESILKL